MVSEKQGETFDKISPLTNEILGTYPIVSYDRAVALVASSRDAFATWKNTTLDGRGRLMRKTAQLLEERQAELAEIVRRETGKPLSDSLAEIGGAIEMGYMMAAHGRFPMGTVLPSAIPLRQARLTRVPLGVAALIVTYNAPIPNFAWKVFPALMAGNTVLIKPSPHTPGSADAFVALLHEAGVPDNVVQVVHGDGNTAAGLIDGGADLVSFTGSHPTGLKVVEAAARTLAKTVIELGGSNPLIVFADAKVDKAAETAKDSAFSNAGQRCASASRVIVEASIFEAFIAAVQKASKNLIVGTSQDAHIGTLIDHSNAKNFEQYLHECVRAGASVERLGTVNGAADSVVLPALVLGLDPKSDLGNREVFGPVMRVFAFSSEAEAIDLANSTEFGLTAAVWSGDLAKAEREVSAIEAGVININGPTHGAEINFPFGGVKHSGNGSRDAGVQAIDAYSDVRVISTFYGV
jgi:aldehyde dehydrogenase (NAD+)